MDQQPVHLPEQEINAEAFREHVNANPTGAFEQWQRMQQQAHQATALPSTQATLDPQTMATIVQLVATTLQNQSQSIRLDTPAPSLPTTASTIHRSEKLPDAPEYDGDRDRLDAWEQSLIQRMHVNHDRYPTDREKIAYAESRLTIGKKAHNLMGQYRRDGLCYLTSFVDWRQKLRHLCGNPFEAEDARTYLRETHKQGSMSFGEYYHLFCQKKERSRMDDASLVDCLKRNVNYATQLAAFSWRNSEGKRPSNFYEYVEAFTEVDEELQQLKHRQPRPSTASPASLKPKSSTALSNDLGNTKSIPLAPVVSVTPAAVIGSGEPMDLSSAIAAVQGKTLTAPGVKDTCNKWKLCYYCKLQHPGKTAKDCPNKKSSVLSVIDLDDHANSDGGVSLPTGKA